jgi:hypothetical protein
LKGRAVVTADTPPRSRARRRGAGSRPRCSTRGEPRLELAALEFEEARARATDNLVLLLVAAAAFGFALLAASMLVVVLFWDSNRIASLVGMTLVYLLIGGFALWRVSEHRGPIRPRLRPRSPSSSGIGVCRKPVR